MPTITIEKGEFDLAYIVEDMRGVEENNFLVLLSTYQGQRATPKLLKFELLDQKWEIVAQHN